MTQNIRPNDLVYLPSVSNKLYKVGVVDGELVIFHDDMMFRINAGGYLFVVGSRGCLPQQFAFLATPENKEKLEQVYGGLEDIPVDKELVEFTQLFNKYTNHIANQSPDQDTEVGLYSKLIQMFKERGSK